MLSINHLRSDFSSIQVRASFSRFFVLALSKCFHWGQECGQTSLAQVTYFWALILWCVQNVAWCNVIFYCKTYIVCTAQTGSLQIRKLNSPTDIHHKKYNLSFQTSTFLLSFLFVDDGFGEPRSLSFSVISSLLFFSSCLSFSSSFFLTSTSSYLFKM